MSNEEQPGTHLASNLPVRLAEFLKTAPPVIWIGAGASTAAGYPSTGELVDRLARLCPPSHIPSGTCFTEAADRFVERMGPPALADIVAGLLSPPRQPTPFHAAVARLCREGKVSAIITTNYDDLVERALANASVPHTVQRLDKNVTVAVPGAVRVLKLHGSQEDWLNIVLSGASYADYQRRYGWLLTEFDKLCRTQWLVFCGCSLRDPRLLRWRESLSAEQVRAVKPWLAVMTAANWVKVPDVLKQLKLDVLQVGRHSEIPDLWRDAAQMVATSGIGWKTAFTQDEVKRIAELREVAEVTIVRPLTGHPDDEWRLRLVEDAPDAQPIPQVLEAGGEIRFRCRPGRHKFRLKGGYSNGAGRYNVSVYVFSQQWAGSLTAGKNRFVCSFRGFRSRLEKWLLQLTPHGFSKQLYELSEPTHEAWPELNDAGIPP